MLGLKRAMRIRYLVLLSVASIALIAWLYVFVVAFVRGRRISECPRCRSDRVRPAWPRLVDKLLRFSFVTPYRCEACRRRFFDLIETPLQQLLQRRLGSFDGFAAHPRAR